MASNYNRKSASSGSRKAPARGRASAAPGRAPSSASRTSGRSVSRASGRSAGKQGSSRTTQQRAYQAIPGGRYPTSGRSAQPKQRLTSVRVGDIDRADRVSRAQSTYRRYITRIVVVASLLVALAIGGVVLYSSNLFAVENVVVTGVEHLTSAEMTELAGVPTDATLLRVDTDTIKARLLKTSWVESAEVKRVFPNTLELAVIERTVAAIVAVPTEDAKTIKNWAIASDHMWLMPIPEQDSEQGRQTSAKIYEDAATALNISDVPYNTKAAIGTYCSDESVNNALDIVSGMTTELAGQVKSVSAAGAEETRLILDNNVEIAFGKAENIRDKERVCIEIMKQNPDVVYINVRVVDHPTWRSL